MEKDKLIGQTIVGYRYGEAPESGRSYNYQTNERECGVSMAQVGYLDEYGSFAISEARSNRKKCYYIGTIAGFGGDDEVCLEDCKKITYREYLAYRKQYKETNNAYVKAIIADKVNLINNGWCTGYTEDEINTKYNKYIK